MSDIRLAARQSENHSSTINVGNETIGGKDLCIIAGPCAVESEEQVFEIAETIYNAGIKFMRGGAFKPRSSPYAFQGLELQGLEILQAVRRRFGLKIVTEVLDTSLIETVYPYADILQVGSRNMKNYRFLKELGKTDKPILLKRGMSSTIEEWLLAAEYILSSGNPDVILCERGIRTFDTSLRNTMDIAAIPLVKELSHLPIIADPSQGTGKRSLVESLSLASIAAGADGLMIEVHNDPDEALSDGFQSIYCHQFAEMLPKLQQQALLSNRNIHLETSKIQSL